MTTNELDLHQTAFSTMNVYLLVYIGSMAGILALAVFKAIISSLVSDRLSKLKCAYKWKSGFDSNFGCFRDKRSRSRILQFNGSVFLNTRVNGYWQKKNKLQSYLNLPCTNPPYVQNPIMNQPCWCIVKDYNWTLILLLQLMLFWLSFSLHFNWIYLM